MPTAAGSPSALQTAKVRAARTAAIRIPTTGSGFPRGASGKLPSARARAAVGLAGVRVERRGQHRPAVAPREALWRLREGADPGAFRLARWAGMLRHTLAFDRLGVPAAFTK